MGGDYLSDPESMGSGVHYAYPPTAVDRELWAIIDGSLLDTLRHTLEVVEQRVVSASYHWFRDRLVLQLDDGECLTLWLYRRDRPDVVGVVSIGFESSHGWIVTVRTRDGGCRRLRAWRVRVT